MEIFRFSENFAMDGWVMQEGIAVDILLLGVGGRSTTTLTQSKRSLENTAYFK
ncbi:hypothetical protein SJ2017_3012 [Shewanella japonica]|uniref:Uncharacterized protein n=1 Tax=Shewanella japonica TaxID=93973 RepID=A0ABM6JN86_9GAMM|nr:hypothetical protein SJ2017_3012 [Shewanella japonica]